MKNLKKLFMFNTEPPNRTLIAHRFRVKEISALLHFFTVGLIDMCMRKHPACATRESSSFFARIKSCASKTLPRKLSVLQQQGNPSSPEQNSKPSAATTCKNINFRTESKHALQYILLRWRCEFRLSRFTRSSILNNENDC